MSELTTHYLSNATEQLLTELAVVLPQFANDLPKDLGDNLMTWVDRIEGILDSTRPRNGREETIKSK